MKIISEETMGTTKGSMSIDLDLDFTDQYPEHGYACGLLCADIVFDTFIDDLAAGTFEIEDFVIEVIDQDGDTITTLDPKTYELDESVIERLIAMAIDRLESN